LNSVLAYRSSQPLSSDQDLPDLRTLLAGKAVGASFVGAVAATLAVSELLRLLPGGAVHELIALGLKFLEYRSAVLTKNDFSALNPGYVVAGPLNPAGAGIVAAAANPHL
jgi:hypothetical protein